MGATEKVAATYHPEQTGGFEAQHAVDRLTSTWSDTIAPIEPGDSYRSVEYPPLLQMLAEAIHASTGATSSGRSADNARNLIDPRAFDMYQGIDEQTRAWILELGGRPVKDLRQSVRDLHDLVEVKWRSAGLDELTYLRIKGKFVRWADEIWETFDPPIIKPIVGACPSCGENRYLNLEGGGVPALRAFYWRGNQPQADCQCCGRQWAGDKQLLELGYHVGATVDEDALREMGVV